MSSCSKQTSDSNVICGVSLNWEVTTLAEPNYLDAFASKSLASPGTSISIFTSKAMCNVSINTFYHVQKLLPRDFELQVPQIPLVLCFL